MNKVVLLRVQNRNILFASFHDNETQIANEALFLLQTRKCDTSICPLSKQANFFSFLYPSILCLHCIYYDTENFLVPRKNTIFIVLEKPKHFSPSPFQYQIYYVHFDWSTHIHLFINCT